VVEAVRARHDGIARNLWYRFECGHHYARAMSSWSLLLALSGDHYGAPARKLSFDPRVAIDSFRCFFTRGSASGSYSQTRRSGVTKYSVQVRYGSLGVRTLKAPCPHRVASPRVAVTGPTGGLEVGTEVVGKRLDLRLATEIRLDPGQVLVVAVT